VIDKNKRYGNCRFFLARPDLVAVMTRCKHNRRRTECKDCRGGAICEHIRVRSKCKDCKGGSICEHGRLRSLCKDCKGGSLCVHSKRRSSCKECKGGSICEHSKVRSQCKECKGGSICEHNRFKSDCKECGGSQICRHDRRRSRCKDCKGGSICEHNRRRSCCVQCNGRAFCQHGRLRSTCKDCGGGQICEHSRRRSQCKDCRGGSICPHIRRKSVCKECRVGKGLRPADNIQPPAASPPTAKRSPDSKQQGERIARNSGKKSTGLGKRRGDHDEDAGPAKRQRVIDAPAQERRSPRPAGRSSAAERRAVKEEPAAAPALATRTGSVAPARGASGAGRAKVEARAAGRRALPAGEDGAAARREEAEAEAEAERRCRLLSASETLVLLLRRGGPRDEAAADGADGHA
jgi:hypothetical protein